MATCLVTGVAGFIGSHLAEKLLAAGHKVIGVDKMADNYDQRLKQANLAELSRQREQGDFAFLQADLGTLELDLVRLLQEENVGFVFHQAARAGVRASWGAEFARYVADNILATQRLLEACRVVPVRRFIYASSSSVYGASEEACAGVPLSEDQMVLPHSPYGVTKLAAEHLCLAYYRNFGIPVVALRYFTVYGPRQRPDMAIYRLLDALQHDRPFPVYGDGGQRRDFTYVDDIVRANVLAAEAPAQNVVGKAFNIGCGQTWTLLELIREAESVAGRKAIICHRPSQSGDVAGTWADISRAKALMGWQPEVQLPEGLERQFRWQANLSRGFPKGAN